MLLHLGQVCGLLMRSLHFSSREVSFLSSLPLLTVRSSLSRSTWVGGDVDSI